MSVPAAAPLETRSQERRRPRSFGAVALGAAFLGALIVAVAFALYVRFIRYERVAARHVPSGSVLALRLDVQQALLYDPVRRHVLPLLGGPTREPKDGDLALSRFEAVTGFNRGDLREIVVARGAERSDWVLVFSGLFPKSTSVGQIATALGSDGSAWTLSPDGRAATRAGGIAVGRAEDGAILVASSVAELDAARPSTDSGVSLGLEPRGPGSFALGRAALAELGRFPDVLARPALAESLGHVARALGELSLGDQVDLRVVLAGADPAQTSVVTAAVAEMLGTFGKMGDSDAASVARGMKERLAPLPGGDGFGVRWDREELDRLFSVLASAIRSGSIRDAGSE